MILAGLLVGFGAAALAHTPHDATLHVAAHPEDPERLVTGIVRAGFSFLLLSEDGGDHWQTRAVPGAGDGVVDAAWLGDELLLATQGGGLLVGDGLSWTRAEFDDPNLSAVVAHDGAALALGTSVWRYDGAWTEVLRLTEAADVLAWDGALACVATHSMLVYCTHDLGETWALRGGAGGPAYDLAIDGDDALVAAEGGLYRLTADAQDDLGLPPPVRAVGVFDDVLLAATDEVVWRSDGGGFEPVSEGIEPPDPFNSLLYGHYRGFRTAGDDLLLAAWEGLHRSTDGGKSWRHLETMGPQWHLDVHVLPGPQVVMASYGGGSLTRLSLDGEFEVTGATSRATHLRISDISPNYLEDGVAWMGERGNLWGTDDAGVSWVDVTDAGPFVASVEAVAVQRDGRGAAVMLAGGLTDEGVTLAWSDDHGQSFHRVDMDSSAGSPTEVFATVFSPRFAEDGRMFAAVGLAQGTAVLRSVGGGRFELLDTLPTRALRLVFSDAQTLWAATPLGLYRWQDDEAGPTVLLAGQWVSDALFVDGAAFAALHDGVVRSEDDGETWTRLDWDPGSSVLDLAASPEVPGVIAAAGPTGAWVSEDSGDTWIQVSTRQRLDVASHAWSLDDGWSRDGSYWASMLAQATAVERGARARFRFEGTQAALYALSNRDQGKVSVTVDGEEPVTVRLRGDDAGSAMVWCGEMAPGWHEITVEATRLPVALDAMEILTEPGLAPEVCSGWTPTCGCQSRAPSPSAALLLLALGWLRRRQLAIAS